MFSRSALGLFFVSVSCFGATFGTVVPVVGGASDLVLDERRNLLYLINTNQNRVEIYSIPQKRLLNPITTDGTPLSAAISRSGNFLYVASRDSSAIDVIDLNSQNVISRVTLPAAPESVAVGNDERVLISTVGSGTGNTSNVLLIYDPSATGPSPLTPVSVTPPPPQLPQLPAPSGKQFEGVTSRLQASVDGSLIIGSNIPASSTATRVVFVYEVRSGSVLRSRQVANSSGVLSVAPDNSKFMSGSTLFDVASLQVLAQENLANSPFLIATNIQFNTQANQGGSVFTPDGSAIYAAFNIAPQTNPATPANVTELMINDPDNLLINMALELPENLAGKIVISSDGANAFALSDSGLLVLPLATMKSSPIAVPDSAVILLTNDQCGAYATQRTGRVTVHNAGGGSRMTVTAQALQATPTNPAGLAGGAGGGVFGGGGVVIILPPVVGGVTVGPGAIAVGATGPATNTAIAQTAPLLKTTQAGNGATLDFTFNPLAARALGTISPSHDFVIQSPEAINVPARVRVYQNYRNADSAGTLVPVPVGISANEALEDLVYDSARQRLYITNSGMNRVEVFDIKKNQFIASVKVGQLPRSIALSPDGGTLYVANSGGENISIVDPDQMQVTGRVKFPPTPLFVNQAVSTPSMIAAGLSGPLFTMATTAANGTSTGTIWQVIGNQAFPRGVSKVIGTGPGGLPKTVSGPISMAATPGGEEIVVSAADGSTYLYDATVDDFVQARTLTSFAQSTGLGYYGTATAGPKGQYFVVNGQMLNQALTPANGGSTGTTRAVASVYPMNATTYARFTQPIRANANLLPSDPGQVEIVDVTTGAMRAAVPALEAPISSPSSTGRATAMNPRTMAIDSTGTNAYILTTSGLSIIPLAAAQNTQRPTVFNKGAVNLASYQTTVAQNGLLSIFGTNLGTTEQATSTPLPYLLGGTCVTLGATPLPLFVTTPGQINAQIPPELATGNYSLVVRSVMNMAESNAQTLAISKYAPAVFVDPVSKQVALLHADGRFVDNDHPAKRDEPLVMYAAGLGLPTSGKISGASPSPSSPLAAVSGVQVFFGPPLDTRSPVIVDWAGLAPGFIGLYQLNLRIPGTHISGQAIPVTIKVGGVSSPSTGPLVPVIVID